MDFGGLPSNTYTTMSLHSSPSLLANMSLDMFQIVGTQDSDKIPGFSTELHTPISVFTGEGYAVQAFGYDISAAPLNPAFLFSFKGQCCIAVATSTAVNHTSNTSQTDHYMHSQQFNGTLCIRKLHVLLCVYIYGRSAS